MFIYKLITFLYIIWLILGEADSRFPFESNMRKTIFLFAYLSGYRNMMNDKSFISCISKSKKAFVGIE